MLRPARRGQGGARGGRRNAPCAVVWCRLEGGIGRSVGPRWGLRQVPAGKWANGAPSGTAMPGGGGSGVEVGRAGGSGMHARAQAEMLAVRQGARREMHAGVARACLTGAAVHQHVQPTPRTARYRHTRASRVRCVALFFNVRARRRHTQTQTNVPAEGDIRGLGLQRRCER